MKTKENIGRYISISKIMDMHSPWIYLSIIIVLCPRNHSRASIRLNYIDQTTIFSRTLVHIWRIDLESLTRLTGLLTACPSSPSLFISCADELFKCIVKSPHSLTTWWAHQMLLLCSSYALLVCHSRPTLQGRIRSVRYSLCVVGGEGEWSDRC